MLNHQSVFQLEVFTGEASLQQYTEQDGYQALSRFLQQPPQEIVRIIRAAGLRGRGGAAFPTGDKMLAVRANPAGQRFVICNADEGEPGTFKDRFLMMHNPFQVLEGMTLAAYAVGASQGYIYIRHEYSEVQEVLHTAIARAAADGFLGANILGSGFSFDIHIFSGAGSYLCGEETALLSSIEGKKGRPRVKPPFPTEAGLWGKPTLIHNVETLANIPVILCHGAAWYRRIGTEDSPGSKLISLSGDVNHRGLYEVPFGTTLRQIVALGGGIPGDRRLKAVNIGGASGVVVPPGELDCLLDYRLCEDRGITIGSGAVFVMDESRSILQNIRNRVDFFIHESCGKCVPCREGLRQIRIIVGNLLAGTALTRDVDRLERFTRTLQQASFCGLGQAAGNSLISSLIYFRREYDAVCRDRADGNREETK